MVYMTNLQLAKTGMAVEGKLEAPEAWGLYKELSFMGWTIPLWDGGLMDQPWLCWQEIMVCAAEDARMMEEERLAAQRQKGAT